MAAEPTPRPFASSGTLQEQINASGDDGLPLHDRPITSKFAPHRVLSAECSPTDGVRSRTQSPAPLGNEAEFFSK